MKIKVMERRSYKITISQLTENTNRVLVLKLIMLDFQVFDLNFSSATIFLIKLK